MAPSTASTEPRTGAQARAALCAKWLALGGGAPREQARRSERLAARLHNAADQPQVNLPTFSQLCAAPDWVTFEREDRDALAMATALAVQAHALCTTISGEALRAAVAIHGEALVDQLLKDQPAPLPPPLTITPPPDRPSARALGEAVIALAVPFAGSPRGASPNRCDIMTPQQANATVEYAVSLIAAARQTCGAVGG